MVIKKGETKASWPGLADWLFRPPTRICVNEQFEKGIWKTVYDGPRTLMAASGGERMENPGIECPCPKCWKKRKAGYKLLTRGEA